MKSNKKLLSIVVVVAMAVIEVGCSNQNESTSTYEAPAYSLDSLTKHISELQAQASEEASSEEQAERYSEVEAHQNEEIAEDNKLAQVIINGTDETQDWSIDGANIIYNGVTFDSLYEAVSAIDIPCDKITFINFVVKHFSTNNNTKEVNITYMRDIDFSTASDDCTDTKADNEIVGTELYTKLANDTGTEINSYIVIGNAALYTCSKYMICTGVDSDKALININMNNADSTIAVELPDYTAPTTEAATTEAATTEAATTEAPVSEVQP